MARIDHGNVFFKVGVLSNLANLLFKTGEAGVVTTIQQAVLGKGRWGRTHCCVPLTSRVTLSHQVRQLLVSTEFLGTTTATREGNDIIVQQVVIKGRSFQEIALFVAKRLSPLDDVLSTATSFVLRTYKRGGRLYQAEEIDERECTVL